MLAQQTKPTPAPAHPVSAPFADDASRWQAVVARNPAADGVFYYSVATTGVFCRPSCAARLAKRANVRFHVTREDAERAGFRPCKRCKPDEAPLAARRQEAVARACRLIESSDDAPSLADLAEAAGLSPHHFHRLFKNHTGVTPKAYATAHRARRAEAELKSQASVTAAIYGAGFSSNGRFYAEAPRRLGMTPTAYRTRGAGTAIRFAFGKSTLGSVLVAATERGVCAIMLGDDPEELAADLRHRFSKAEINAADAAFANTVAAVVELVENPGAGVDLPLDILGTAFQIRVWQALQKIPAGATTTYSEIAAAIGRPAAVRAVGTACGANPLAVVVPCHRALRTSGALAGYRWGLARKAELLKRERG